MGKTMDEVMSEYFVVEKTKMVSPCHYNRILEWDSKSKFYKPSRRRYMQKYMFKECYPLGAKNFGSCRITFYASNITGLFWACPEDHSPYQIELQAICSYLGISVLELMSRAYALNMLVKESKMQSDKKKRERDLKLLRGFF